MTEINENINIIYSAIVREKHTILSEYTECSGNFSQIITHIMTEIIMRFENPLNSYRTYFYIGKYAIFLIKYQKIYILIMFPNTKINNIDIIFSLLYSFFQKLQKEKDIDFEKMTKMRAYSLSHFSDIFKEQIEKFNSNNNSFNSFLANITEFSLYEPFKNRNFETDIQLPILSITQVHNENNNKNKDNDNYMDKDKDKVKDDNEITNKNTYLSNSTFDSFKDDILRQDSNEANEKLIDEDHFCINEVNLNLKKDKEENLIILKQNNNQIKKKRLSHILLIVVLLLIIIGICIGLFLLF